jgi:hypothetical protein|tara:strand:+ start:535 stop:762 length:228 start_codon:yes stop_codon:yes gene_type:complete
MRKILLQYFWIFGITIVILLVTMLTFPDKKNRLDYIEEKIKEVEEKKRILTQKEIELEKLANEKDWEEVDKNSTK